LFRYLLSLIWWVIRYISTGWWWRMLRIC
jgi:hypothetical protein